MKNKICIQSDGTNAYGKKIIDYLISKGGGNNESKLNGAMENFYYYINEVNKIKLSADIPHSFRSTFIDDSNGINQEYSLPVQAIASKSHYIMGGPTNYASNNFINNSYL